MKLLALSSIALIGSLLVGCGGAGQPEPAEEEGSDFPADQLPADLHPDLPLITPKEGDIAMFSDIVEFEPGADVTLCTFTDMILEKDTILGEAFGAQSPFGHHAIFQYATTPQEPGTRDCGEMSDFNILLGGTGGKTASDKTRLPDNVGMMIPAGAQLVLNHHWINTSPEAATGQAMMVAHEIEPADDVVLAGSMIVTGMGWELAPQADTTFTTECTYQEPVDYILAGGHMHEWGSHVTIDVQRVDGTTDVILDHDWTEADATGDSTTANYPIDDPLLINAGDTVRLTCNWRNDTADTIAFPREMCIFFGNTIGDDYLCANDFWLRADEVAGARKQYEEQQAAEQQAAEQP